MPYQNADASRGSHVSRSSSPPRGRDVANEKRRNGDSFSEKQPKAVEFEINLSGATKAFEKTNC